MRDGATAGRPEAQKLVLVVDDQDEVLTALRLALELRGFNVLTESSPFEGVRVAATKEPDLIVLDIDMPGMDGAEAARHLKRIGQTRSIPLIAFTGRGWDSVGSLKRCGFETVVSKTDGLEPLEYQIDQLLETQGTRWAGSQPPGQRARGGDRRITAARQNE